MQFLKKLKLALDRLILGRSTPGRMLEHVFDRNLSILDKVLESILLKDGLEHSEFRGRLTRWRKSYIGKSWGLWTDFSDSANICEFLGDSSIAESDIVSIFADPDMHYRRFWLPSRRSDNTRSKGRVRKRRLIHAPDDSLLSIHRLLLREVLDSFDLVISDAAHSYRPRRSPRTCMFPHKSSGWMICMDFRNFFGTITEDKVLRALVDRLGCPSSTAACYSRLFTVNCEDKGIRVLPQGAPTSGFISNVCLIGFDQRLRAMLSSVDSNIVYTRYADDIVISGPGMLSKSVKSRVIALVSQAANGKGFVINNSKTRVYSGASVMRALGIDIRGGELFPRKSIIDYIEKQVRLIKTRSLTEVSNGWGGLVDGQDNTLKYLDHLWGLIIYASGINRRYAQGVIAELENVETPLSGRLGLIDS
ncbi:RNA-directed DNA polymerase [Brevibacterium aurantiacum]|uniref:reverse transcriptase family protein n=1 Tax=Brevibacterium aurantiacum TaxID=273384 RepID=UPI000DF138CA|nr:reverse transcriptase family protein [Brevibacterium aurantiacum]RCS94567.1 RNA-directed DNA polymerase [Brevibacterium aurantiacum]